MKFYATASAVVTSLALLANNVANVVGQDAQVPIRFDAEHNFTTLAGTWASGSQQVITGPGFAQPANMSFIYPKVTGISYSFSDDGFYETARYRFNSNATNPVCITGILIWSHGLYHVQTNGSIVLEPFGDGYQQVQAPCDPQGITNFVQEFNYTELISTWRIFHDDQTGGNKLHLWDFDGTPMAPMFQVSDSPNMLPTRRLRDPPPKVLNARSVFKRAFGAWLD